MRRGSIKRYTTRPGISLIEAVVSLSVVSVLMLGLSGSVMLGAHAIPTDSELGVADREIQDICNMLRADIRNAKKIDYNKSGNTVRIRLQMLTFDQTDEGKDIEYEFIGDINMLRRRVDGRDPIVLSNSMASYDFSVVEESGKVRYVIISLRFDDTIQQHFQIHVLTPYRPDLA